MLGGQSKGSIAVGRVVVMNIAIVLSLERDGGAGLGRLISETLMCSDGTAS